MTQIVTHALINIMRKLGHQKHFKVLAPNQPAFWGREAGCFFYLTPFCPPLPYEAVS